MKTPHILGHCYMCGLTILCGTCGNNQCNGNRGRDGTCPDCDSPQALSQECFSRPVTYAEVRATRENIQAWQVRQLKSIPDMAGSSDIRWSIDLAIELATCSFMQLAELDRALTAHAEDD